MESVTFHQCVKGAWRDSWRYLQHQPAMALSFLLGAWLSQWIEAVLVPDRTLPFRLITYVPLGVFELLKIALFSVLTIQAMRFVLLEKREVVEAPFFASSYWRYLGITFGMALVLMIIVILGIALGIGRGSTFAVIAMLAFSLQRHGVAVLVPVVMGASVAVAVCAGGFLLGRFSLLSTHAAIGGAVRVRDAWADTHGHYWSIVLTQFGALVPVLVVWLLLTALQATARRHGLGAMNGLGAALVYVGTLCVGAACSAWLYRRYANALCGNPSSSHLR